MKFKNKKEKMGYILGAICFVPSFIISFIFAKINIIFGTIIMILTQTLWLKSMELIYNGIEQENIKLKNELKKYKE